MKALKVTYDDFYASPSGSEVAQLSAICSQGDGLGSAVARGEKN